jgi:hypothetical protein
MFSSELPYAGIGQIPVNRVYKERDNTLSKWTD